MRGRNLVGRSFKRGVSVWEKNIFEKSTEDGLKLAPGSEGHKRRAVGTRVSPAGLLRAEQAGRHVWTVFARH